MSSAFSTKRKYRSSKIVSKSSTTLTKTLSFLQSVSASEDVDYPPSFFKELLDEFLSDEVDSSTSLPTIISTLCIISIYPTKS